MHVILAGGTGFLGRALAAALAADGHDVAILTRAAGAAPSGSHLREVIWDARTTGAWTAAVAAADAVINLSGESIAARRWSAAQKRRILDSRIHATRCLATVIRGAAVPPAVFLSGSAVGYYGPLGDEIATEEHGPGSDFLARVCVQWETEATAAKNARTRIVFVRTGLVLERDGGALPRMLLPFRLGLGGPLGSGRQWSPWIHRRDWIDLVRWLLVTPAASGAVNATAPNPVTNAEFARALGRALHRPAFMPAPGFALSLVLGEMADSLLLSGQRAVPAKAEHLGFTFQYPHLDDALRVLFP